MNVLIIGATSGIGNALARLYAEGQNRVIATGRRTELLEELRSKFPDRIIMQTLDINNTESAVEAIESVWQKIKTVDLAILCSGVGDLNPNLDFSLELPTLSTNVIGWTNAVDLIYRKFLDQGFGHLGAITSVGGLRGEPNAAAYSASKAYQINYTEALRKKAYKSKKPIFVSDIRPGLVDTRMAKGEGLFWVMPAEKIASQIAIAISKKRSVTVVSKRWNLLHFIMRILPNWIYDKI